MPVDLSNYSLSSCSNGCDITGEFDYPDNVTFSAEILLNHGNVFVVANPKYRFFNIIKCRPNIYILK